MMKSVSYGPQELAGSIDTVENSLYVLYRWVQSMCSCVLHMKSKTRVMLEQKLGFHTA